MEEDQELQNPFPSPPSHYTKYTSHNLHLLSRLRLRLEETGQASDPSDAEQVNQQRELLANEADVPDWSLMQLEKPRVDWILEEGVYNAFGDTWFTKERIPTLAEMGGTQLYPEDPTVDRRPALQSVLRSLLRTYSAFLSSILVPPPPPQVSNMPPDWQRLLEWMRVMSQNIMGAANDLRPVQARGNLEVMMTRQLELRRKETKAIHEKCDALEAKLEDLRKQAAALGNAQHREPDFQQPVADIMDVDIFVEDSSETLKPSGNSLGENGGEILPSTNTEKTATLLTHATEDDVLKWAEQAG